MEFSPGFLGSFIFGSDVWPVRISDGAVGFGQDGRCISLEAIARVECKTGLVWATVEIQSEDERVLLRGVTNRGARKFVGVLRQGARDALLGLLEPHRDGLEDLWQKFNAFLNEPRFLAQWDLVEWGRCCGVCDGDMMRVLKQVVQHPFFVPGRASGASMAQAETLGRALLGDGSVLDARNAGFVERELMACARLFDTVETLPLTDEQRRAAVVMEDRSLLVASAGSGKTSTVVGKVGYVLSRELMAANEILLLAFNNHAAREIEARIRERLEPLLGRTLPVKVRTFHALGLEIIGEVAGARPKVADFSAQGEDAQVVDDLISDLVATDASFARDWVWFLALYADEGVDPATFGSVDGWRDYVRGTGVHENGRWGFRTLNGELALSQGERAIANWLFLNGIDYEYERPCSYQTRLRQYRLYRPAFYLPSVDLYIAHDVLGEDEKPPAAFRDGYGNGLAWRRAVRATGEADVFETVSSAFLSGALISKLEKELARVGGVRNPISPSRALEKIEAIQPQKPADVSRLIRTFIKHAKSNQMSGEVLTEAAQRHPQRARAALFVRIVARVMDRYADVLRSRGEIDFDDMILRAAQYAHEERCAHPFRLILVDEFQDISTARADLLLGLLKHRPECKLFGVGDDWQSIYRFAGSDIRLFTGFEGHFGKTATNYLTRTFRSNRGIAEAAAHFVQQNDAQMKKVVVAEDSHREDTLIVRYFKRREDVARHIEACLAEIAQEAREAERTYSVYLLGRYRHQVPDEMARWEVEYDGVLDLEYRTVHGSKGLQADFVIVLGLQSGRMGFPSEMVDDSLLGLVMPEPEAFPHAEERRLFYIALTRARHRVYLLGSESAPSCFLTELTQRNPAVSPMIQIVKEDPHSPAPSPARRRRGGR